MVTQKLTQTSAVRHITCWDDFHFQLHGAPSVWVGWWWGREITSLNVITHFYSSSRSVNLLEKYSSVPCCAPFESFEVALQRADGGFRLFFTAGEPQSFSVLGTWKQCCYFLYFSDWQTVAQWGASNIQIWQKSKIEESSLFCVTDVQSKSLFDGLKKRLKFWLKRQ